MAYTSIEICAGAGGQALGLEMAGFKHLALVEYEPDYCACLKSNRPEWNVICQDVRQFDGKPYHGQVDLLAGGVPCPPFSVAGKQLGEEDERDLFPQMLRLIEEIQPRIAMIENVRGLLDTKFDAYRAWITGALEKLGYTHHTQLLNASDYGVPQLRPRVVIIAVSAEPVTAVPSVRDAKKSKVRHNPTASHLRGSIWHRCGSLWRSSGSNKPANKSELDVE